MKEILYLSTLRSLLKVLRVPITLMGILILAYLTTSALHYLHPNRLPLSPQAQFAADIVTMTLLATAIYWSLLILINFSHNQLNNIFRKRHYKTLLIVLPLIENSLKIISFVALVYFLTLSLDVPENFQIVLERLLRIIMIIAISLVSIRAVNGYEKTVTEMYSSNLGDVKARRMYTQVRVFKQIIYTIIVTFAFAGVLMVFDSVRQIGLSIFASAGLFSAILVFAAQKSLANMIACLQIALTEAIKIGDFLIVESEFCTVEEITLTYVVVKVWDLRRLILPLSYFIEKPFQNLSRETALNLLCPVFIYVDYRAPFEALRQEFFNVIEKIPTWDHKVKVFQVSDAKPNVAEIRLLGSAADPGEAWSFRCELREKMIAAINQKFPEALPVTRYIPDNTPNATLINKKSSPFLSAAEAQN